MLNVSLIPNWFWKWLDGDDLPLCQNHPAYRAIRKPRKECPRCWAVYRSKKNARAAGKAL